ncbi:hypothetical protein HII36_11640 [Nonomuraea sp. NN258]|uniref:DUF6461 domain-containing protein n=1 Tax=Nonomuraea antri TaxID=2730852 RepID=UPI001568A85F|nr:DUF6461 domain-containing protein [Nonomuraea antri]NRQ32486.1 hypothetical protein [Nonomuraea antri]
MIATAADYRWFYDRFPSLWEAYCITLVKGLAPEDVVTRLDARTEDVVARFSDWFDDVPSGMSFDDLDNAAYAGPGPYGGWPGHFFGATDVGGWCLIVEPNGFMGSRPKIIKPLSAGTRLVSHFSNVNAVQRFYWAEDGEIRLGFEPPFAADRHGSDPDGALEAMRRAGLDLACGVRSCTIFFLDDTATQIGAVFALAENLTGLKLTAGLLEESTYLCAVTPRKN